MRTPDLLHPPPAPPERPKRSPAVRILRALASLAGWSLIVATVGLCAATASDSSRIWIVLASALAAWAIPLSLTALLVFLFARHWRSALVAGIVMALVVIWLQPFPHTSPFGTTTATSGDATDLTALALNLQFGLADPNEVVAAVRAKDVDVLVTTELTTTAVQKLDAAGLAELMPHRELNPDQWGGATGTGIFSRYPLTAKHLWPNETTFTVVEATVMLPQTSITVIGAHPPPPQHPGWRSDFDIITRHVAPRLANGERLLLAGDFNATTTHAPMRGLLAVGLNDATSLRRWAWQDSTWPNDHVAGIPLTSIVPPLLRLDHVLIPPTVQVTHVDAVDVTGSDHRGVLTDLSWR